MHVCPTRAACVAGANLGLILLPVYPHARTRQSKNTSVLSRTNAIHSLDELPKRRLYYYNVHGISVFEGIHSGAQQGEKVILKSATTHEGDTYVGGDPVGWCQYIGAKEDTKVKINSSDDNQDQRPRCAPLCRI